MRQRIVFKNFLKILPLCHALRIPWQASVVQRLSGSQRRKWQFDHFHGSKSGKCLRDIFSQSFVEEEQMTPMLENALVRSSGKAEI